MRVWVANETAGGVATLLRITRCPVGAEIWGGQVIDRGIWQGSGKDRAGKDHARGSEGKTGTLSLVMLFAPEIGLSVCEW
jgi:hypothetical protein